MREDVERTEPPTPYKIEEARRRGYVPKSREIVGLFLLLSLILFLWFAGTRVLNLMNEGVGLFEFTTFPNAVATALNILIQILFPVFLVAVVFAVLGNIVQTGFVLSSQAIEPRFEKINPASGFQRIFSTRGLVEFAKSLLKVAVISYIVFVVLSSQAKHIDEFFGVPIHDVIPKSAKVILKIIIWILVFLIFLSVLDYAWQRWDWWRSLHMTRSELREEMRRYEGDPQVKGRLRQRMFEMARSRMMQEVQRADVVITNPTHIAVALRYERGKMKAPQVVAKGMGWLAERIVQIARENDIPIYQDPPLAWALWRSTKVGDFIPEELYRAVARVLAYVMMLKRRTQNRTA